ncbi:MAG TPA: ImcF-related family protein [Longimicrobiaceae bacterium]
MKTRKAWIAALVTLAGFLLLAVVLDWLLPINGADRVLLWVGMLLLGGIAAFLLYLQLAPRTAKKKGQSDVELLLAAARERLKKAGISKGKPGRLPVTLVIGPTGCAKTTSVLQSGLGAELLAGETSGPAGVAPTEAVNIWYARGGLIVEAGGKVPGDAERWRRLLQGLRPARLAAALGRGKQPPRVAVACVSCDLLQTSGSGAAPSATQLRDALAEVARQWGVRLPVYALFTKADRIPHFEEYVRGMTREETQELLGATLPLAEVTPGDYADHQAHRLRTAFGNIFGYLAARRLELLPREQREADRGGAYEFPREIRKLTEAASLFLTELCRPSQLGMNPFLRGFYFAGVRPVIVSDTPAASPQPQQRISLEATGVFGIPSLTAPQPAARPSGGRRVPDWVFLRRLFPEVILADERAHALTAGGRRVDLLRRSLLAAAAVLLLVLSTGFTVSYVNNRALLARGRDALEAVRPLAAAVGEAPPEPSLVRLDSLRATVDRLSDHLRGRPPLRLRWGLYTGDKARLPLRQVYFDRFTELLWGTTRGDLLATLQSLPDQPQATEDYSRIYEALRAYLVTTSHPQESTPEILTPVLLREWRFGDSLDPARRELTSRQFDFFARELPLGHPLPAEPSEPVVIAAREFLAKFTGVEPFYRALLSEAARAGEPIRFAELYPQASAVVQSSQAVPAEFTQAGWARVDSILADLDRLLTREDWVLGERAAIAPSDRERLAADLRTRYVTDYADAWQQFLESASVAGFSGPADAARKLDLLASNQSPLLQLIALASRHTSVDSTVLRQLFQPVYAVIPPGESDSYINDANAPYMGGLVSLQSAMAQVADATGPDRTEALAQAQMSVQQLDLRVSELTQGFRTEGRSVLVGNQVQRLLESPVVAARGLVRGLPTAQVNAAGASFCAPFRALEARYPFDERAVEPASIDDLSALLGRPNSRLWSFYEEQLSQLLIPQGNQYAAPPAAEPRPTEAFTAFFNRAARISEALFPDGAESPTVRFALQVSTSNDLPEVRVTIDGQTHAFTRTMPAAHTYVWDGARARTVRVTKVVDGVETTLLEGSEGPWALLRLLHLASWEQTGAQQYRLRWLLAEAPGELTATLTFASRVPIFAPGQLRLGCVSQILR